jgi:CheY-like chemotaxis protein
MIESGELLRRLLSDILDLSQIEAGSLVLQPAVFNFHKMIAETVRLVQPDATRKNLQLQVTVDPGIPDFVSSDETRLQQIVLNYLNNAIKFTEAGAVEFSVLLLSREDRSLTLQIRVSDTGVGIPVAKHGVVFDAFEQADSSSTRRKGGCGLGLSIVKRLAHLLGGSVGMESQLGFGSTFWANVVVTAAAAPQTVSISEAPSPYSAEIASLKILVAEDNRVNQMITRRMLNRLGCANIDIAENGNQVLSKADATAYDMILMDVHMPELDGIETTRALRTGRSQTPIVALTASVLDADRVRCREAGMDDFVPKPVELNELRRVIESVLAARLR